MSGGNWSTETYRLDDVINKFSLPCVVCFSEGFMDATESESISKDDVIKIDKRMILQKIAAEFMNDADERNTAEVPKYEPEDFYADIKVDEILIPLNYGGKVMVRHNKQICHGVNNLRRIFPRYAQVLSNVDVVAEDGTLTTIQADTLIELDRVIPGTKSTLDHLVVQYDKSGKFVEATIPVFHQGKFRILPDKNEYTLHEVIERYGFPVVVTFIDDEIRRIYTIDIEEGIDNMKLITATVRLKRLDQQDAIIGHYKPLNDTPYQKQGSEHTTRRSLVVLPLDNSDIREIQVHVLLDADEEVYDEMFVVSNKSRELNDVLDGTLYVDFSKKSGPRYIKTHKHNKLKEVQQPKPHSRLTNPDPLVLDDDLYEEVSASSMTQQTTTASVQSTVSPTLAEMNFDKYTGDELSFKEEKQSTLQKLKNKVTGGKEGKDYKSNRSVMRKLSFSFFKKDKPVPALPDNTDDMEDDPSVYDYPDETEIIQLQSKMKTFANLSEKDRSSKPKKPVARILPNKATGQSQFYFDLKPFNTLTKVELELRLIQCGMAKFATICRDKELDGKFLDTISNDILKQEPFNLSPFDLVKLERVKQDWIPS